MIEPTYRRDHLWSPPRRSIRAAVLGGACVGVALTVASLAVLARPRSYVFIDDSPAADASTLVTKLAHESFPAWRAHHTGCPHRLSDLLPNTRLDPWGHALHYTCDPRLAHRRRFAVLSAGEDGVFGTADDISAHD